MLQRHHYPGNASFTPHVLLHEIGAPFELKLVQRMQGAHKQPEYLKLNPNGQIPVLVAGELVLYETIAICMHLADTHPGAALAPPLGTRERGHCYKWLAWLSNTVLARAVAMLALLDEHLGAQGGEWLLGAHYSAADAMAFVLCRWTRDFDDRPARSFTHIAPFLQRMLACPAVQRVFEAEALAKPWV